MAGLLTLRVFARNLWKKYFSYFLFDDRPGIRTQAFASNKPTHYILDHGDQISEIAEEILFVFCFDVWPGA